jgi:hypothetical protein
VGRPPQELMRGWGRPPICKASGPDHGLGIRATHNLVEEGKKGSVVWAERTDEECRDERKTLGSKEGLREKSELGSQRRETESGEGE